MASRVRRSPWFIVEVCAAVRSAQLPHQRRALQAPKSRPFAKIPLTKAPAWRTRGGSMNSLFDLSGEIAVVIGATGVLGGGLADGLAAAGAKVAVLGRNAERGEARVQAIRTAGGEAQVFAAGGGGRAGPAEGGRANRPPGGG